MKNWEIMTLSIVASVITTNIINSTFKKGYKRDISSIRNTVDSMVNTIADGIKVEPSEKLIKTAVTKAVDSKVGSSIDAITLEVSKEASKSIKSEVKNIVTVMSASDELKATIEERFEKQISKIDISDIKEEAVKKVSKKAYKKLDKELDVVIEQFSKYVETLKKGMNRAI